MNNLSLIVAIGKNNELGVNNHLIWHLPNDMKFFKETTINHTIIMGRKTFESLPGILPKRKHIILTSNLDYKPDNAIVFHSIEEVLEYIQNNPEEESFVIGGASIYKEFLPYCENLYITEIDAPYLDADVYFPIINKKDYTNEVLKEYIDDSVKYKIIKYSRVLNKTKRL